MSKRVKKVVGHRTYHQGHIDHDLRALEGLDQEPGCPLMASSGGREEPWLEGNVDCMGKTVYILECLMPESLCHPSW